MSLQQNTASRVKYGIIGMRAENTDVRIKTMSSEEKIKRQTLKCSSVVQYKITSKYEFIKVNYKAIWKWCEE